MPIVIQELLASDTISQAVDKINFNFDQLLLNGGGPVGPAGVQGPTGPIGGRGIKGTAWYDGNADPNTLIIPGIEQDDYFLQSNGEVWQYNGTAWVQTTINLTGPAGAAGAGSGFGYIGGFSGGSINNQNTAFVVPMPSGLSGGANPGTNQGVSTVLLGAVGSTAAPLAGISYTSAFQIPDLMAAQLDSSLVSVLIHQKDSSSSAIRFMGGGDNPTDNYNQTNLNDLSNISLGIDDTLNINVFKSATLPTDLAELIGFNVNTIKRGQQFLAGKHINFITGNDSQPSGFLGETSDVKFTINTSNPSIPAKFSVATTLPSASALFEVGGNITVPPTSLTRTGIILFHSRDINIIANDLIKTRTNININEAFNTYEIISPSITLKADGGAHQIFVDNSSPTAGGTKLTGNVTWAQINPINPIINTHRNIFIDKGNLSFGSSPIYIRSTNVATGRNLMIDVFRGELPTSSTEHNKIYTASTDIKNTGDIAQFVGHTVENTSLVVSQDNVGFKLIGRDRNGNPTLGTKFHAQENTTSVSNRMQYVRKYLNINPLTAGINVPPNPAYTIPPSFMDCSFLDIYVGWDGDLIGGIDLSSNVFAVLIPPGLYPGQRLNIHLMVAPTMAIDSLNDPQTEVRWPNPLVEGSQQGKVILIADDWFTLGTAAFFPIFEITADPIPIPYVPEPFESFVGGEGYVELMWVGETYKMGVQRLGPLPPNIPSVFEASRGWMVVNAVAKESGPVNDPLKRETSRTFN
jgi:hypothetical protein